MAENLRKRRQGQKGATPKVICPKCEEEYLKTAWGQENKKMKRIGQYCPNHSCDYIIKDLVQLEDTEEEENTNSTDKAEKIKKLTDEFLRKHEELNRLAEKINELETEC